jgi:transketolase
MCGDGNIQSAFSCIDFLWVLYNDIMRWSPERAKDDDRDICIISKGQATLALYAVLIEKGMFTLNDMHDIGSFDSRFSIQADVTKFPEGGVENSAGSLGHGLPFATGAAYANKVKKSPSQVYVITGDGEFCEGTMWEACLFAATKGLENLFVLIDDNDSVKTMVNMGGLRDKLESFGFDVIQTDGHCPEKIKAALSGHSLNGKPKAIILDTVRGYGSVTLMENDIWFRKAPDSDELETLYKEIDGFNFGKQ